MKPYYDQDGITIYHGDCREVLPTLAEVGAIIADPPYGMNWEGNQRFSGGNTRRGVGTKHSSIVGDDIPFDPAFLLEYKKPTVIWGANHFWDKLPPAASLVWLKRNDGTFGTFLSDAEIAFLSVGFGVYVHRRIFSGSLRAIDAGKGAYKGSAHPNQKPVSLMAWCFAKAKIEHSALIVDPYTGSGSTLVAAKLEGRRAIGIEIEEKYCEVAAHRLAQGVLFGVPA